MREWAIKDAGTGFSELLDACLYEGPQVLTIGGRSKAVLISAGSWQAPGDPGRRSLKDVLLSGGPGIDLDLEERGPLFDGIATDLT